MGLDFCITLLPLFLLSSFLRMGESPWIITVLLLLFYTDQIYKMNFFFVLFSNKGKMYASPGADEQPEGSP